MRFYIVESLLKPFKNDDFLLLTESLKSKSAGRGFDFSFRMHNVNYRKWHCTRRADVYLLVLAICSEQNDEQLRRVVAVQSPAS